MTGRGVPRLPQYLSAIGNTINYSREEQVQETKKGTSSIPEQLGSHLPQVPNQVERKILQLLKCYPEGLEIEKFNVAYLKRYGKPLIASEFGFLDIIDLLGNLKGNILKVVEVSGQQLLLKADKDFSAENKGDQHYSPQGSEESMASQVPDEIVSVIKAIVKDNKGGIDLQNLNIEFEMKTNKKLDLESLGFSCIYDLVSSLGENFKIFDSGTQFILCDSAIKTVPYSDITSSVVDSHSTVRILSNETKERLRNLLQEEFPCGITIDEILGAYRGLYGAELDDLNPLTYGYRTLAALFENHPDDVLLQYCNGTIMVIASQSQLSEEMMDFTLSPVKAVSFRSVYKNLDQNALLHVGEYVEVVIAEIYSPDKFWVILREPETSGALDCLMNQLFEFYSSKVGDRYLVAPHVITIGAPVVVYYEDDKNYYRALITSIEDVRTVKLFLVDYGTVFTCDYSNLRQLHEKFFTFPAQAIKAALDDIVPPDGKKLWPKTASKRFLNMVENKGLVAKVTMLKEKVYMELWDTSEKADINIADVLIVEGLAVSNKPIDCGNILSRRSFSGQNEAHTSSYQKPRKGNLAQETVPVRFPKCELPTQEESKNSLNFPPSGSMVDESGVRKILFDNKPSFTAIGPVNESGINCNQKESQRPELERADLTSYCNLSSFTQSDLIFSDPLHRKEIFSKGQEDLQLYWTSSYPYHNMKQSEHVATQILPSSHVKSDELRDEMCMYQEDLDFKSLLNSRELRISLPDSTSLIPGKTEEKLIRVTPKSSSGPALVNVLSPPQLTSIVKYISPPPGFEHLGFLPTTTHVESPCSSQVSNSVQDFGYIGSHVREEVTECRRFHSVELVKISDSYSFHVLMLYGTPYVLAADISRILESNGNIDTALDQKGWKFPSISIGKFTDKELYHQLFKLGSGVIYDEAICEVRPCLSAFPLRNVAEILKLLGFHDKKTFYVLEELMQKYSQDEVLTNKKESNMIENCSSADNLIYDISGNLKVAGGNWRDNCSERDCSNSRNLNFEVPQNETLTYDRNKCTSNISESYYVNEPAKPGLDVSCVDYRLSEILSNPLKFIKLATDVNQNKVLPENPINSSSYAKQSTPLVRFPEVCQATEFANSPVRVSEGPLLEKKKSTVADDNNQRSIEVCPAISQEVFFSKDVSTVSPSSIGVLDVEKNINDIFKPVYDDKSLIASNQVICNTRLPIASCSDGGNTTSRILDARKVCNFLSNPALPEEPNIEFCHAFNNIFDGKIDTAVGNLIQFSPQKNEISHIAGAKEMLDFSGAENLESFASVPQGLKASRTRWLKHTVNRGGLRKPNKIHFDLPVHKSVTQGSQENSNPLQSGATQQSVTASEKEEDDFSRAFTPQSLSSSNGASCFKPLFENVDVSAKPGNLASGSLEPRENDSCGEFDTSRISSDVRFIPGTLMTTPVNEHILHHGLLGKKSPDELYLVKGISVKNKNQNTGATCISTSSSFKEIDMNGCKIGPQYEGVISPNKNPCPQGEVNSRVPWHCACKDSVKEDAGKISNKRCKPEVRNVTKEELAIGKLRNDEKVYSLIEEKPEERKFKESEILHRSAVNRIRASNSSPESPQITSPPGVCHSLSVDQKEYKGNEKCDNPCPSLDIKDHEQLLQELKLLKLGLQLKKQEYKTIVNNSTDCTLPSVHHHSEKLNDVIFELRKKYKEKKIQIENIIIKNRDQRSHFLAEKQLCHAKNFENPPIPVRNPTNKKMPCGSSSRSDHDTEDVLGRDHKNTELALDQVEEGLWFPSCQSNDPVCSKNPSGTKMEQGYNVNTKFPGDQSLQNDNLSCYPINNQNTLVSSKETEDRFDDLLHQPEIKGNMGLSDLPGRNLKTQNNINNMPYPVPKMLGIGNRGHFTIPAGNHNRDFLQTGCPHMSQAYPYRANPTHHCMGPMCYDIPLRPRFLAFSQPLRPGVLALNQSLMPGSLAFNQVSQSTGMAPSSYLYGMYPHSLYPLPM